MDDHAKEEDVGGSDGLRCEEVVCHVGDAGLQRRARAGGLVVFDAADGAREILHNEFERWEGGSESDAGVTAGAADLIRC